MRTTCWGPSSACFDSDDRRAEAAAPKGIEMGKIYLGFGLALVAFGLCAVLSYQTLQEVQESEHEAREAHLDKLIELRDRIEQVPSRPDEDPVPLQRVRALVEGAIQTERDELKQRGDQARNQKGGKPGPINPLAEVKKIGQPEMIVLMSSTLALLITGLSLFLISRDVRGREEAEFQLALAHTNLEVRVRERTADLARANEELQQARTDLEARVRERTADLARANEELRRFSAEAEAANRAKSEFLANMSHELRTPLNSVIGFTNILLKNKAGNLRDQEITFLERVLDNGKHLLKLINEVLDLAKVESGRMELELETVALGDLIDSTLAGLEGQLKGKDVRLVAELPPRIASIETDSGKLKQVLINLIGNAIKFTEHGSVTVRVETNPDNGRPTALDVIDTGIGIPPDKRDKIFEAFQQADASMTREYGGTGLGLTIARSLCQLMGYDIEVHSTVGKGSLFRIVLGENAGKSDERVTAVPRKPSLTKEILLRREQMPALVDIHGKRVLIIDDDCDSRILLTQYIEDCGCRVIAVDCGEHGLKVGHQFLPDLIVLDLMMPEMSGWEVLKALKADPTLSNVPVVVVSIVARENRGTILGAVDLLDKPVSREALHALLHRILQSRKGRALVVDDNADARRLLSAYLVEEGFETCEAVNGAEALARLERFEADLVILDLMMPVMDGLSFLGALRRDSRHLRLPVVVVTAKDLTQQEIERLGEDGSVVLRKGDELALGLKRVVGEVLGHREDGAAN
jgi:signal transduction histidine kinase/DNA-binding response OmpR family regulator